MTWFFVALVVVVMGGVALVAAGRGGALPPAWDDRPDVRVPAGPLTAGDLRRVRFSVTLRGYRMSEVDTLLVMLADQLAERVERDDRRTDASDDDGPRGARTTD